MTKPVLLDALKDLLDKEFNEFKWYLLNGGLTDSSISRGDLENADRQKVVDLMVRQYKESDAGKIAIRALCSIKQNELADKLKRNLPEVQQPEQVDGRNAPVSVEEPLLIQSDWIRPGGMIPCSQEFKNRILRENRDDIYIPKEKSQRKRLALLITNIKFEHKEYDRDGAELDEENMEWLLKALGYSVQKHRNLSGEEINAAVKNFAARSEHQYSDSTFVVIMSHGDRIDNKDAILGVHYHQQNPKDFFFVDDIFSHLNSEKCPALIDKPKVILIQACRGERKGGMEILSDTVVHVEKDFVSFKSCLPGISAFRTGVNGSFFICYIVEVFYRWAHTDDIMELFRKVTSCMEKDPQFKKYKGYG